MSHPATRTPRDVVSQLRACRIRLTLLDENDVPTGTPIVTQAFTDVQVEPVYLDGPVFKQQDIHGNRHLDLRGVSRISEAQVTFGTIDDEPDLTGMLGNGEEILLGGDEGWALPEAGAGGWPYGLSVEVWVERRTIAGPHVYPYAWWAYPKVVDIRQGAWVHGMSPYLPQWRGFAVPSAAWGLGPEGDWPGPPNPSAPAQWVWTDTIPDVTPHVGWEAS